ncbi:MAG: hypothetical protein IKF78_13580, partial [Atopobiaceae bacterium]|nr:hypothetical protein [Atopobiaceae bacterium]
RAAGFAGFANAAAGFAGNGHSVGESSKRLLESSTVWLISAKVVNWHRTVPEPSKSRRARRARRTVPEPSKRFSLCAENQKFSTSARDQNSQFLHRCAYIFQNTPNGTQFWAECILDALLCTKFAPSRTALLSVYGKNARFMRKPAAKRSQKIVRKKWDGS